LAAGDDQGIVDATANANAVVVVVAAAAAAARQHHPTMTAHYQLHPH